MNKQDKIYIAGHRGMVGSALFRALKERGYAHILTATSDQLDLRNQADVQGFFEKEQPDYVFLAAAKVGGIHANNQYKADFIYENSMIQSNVIHASYVHKVKKLMFLGSSCIYPKAAPQPMKESFLLTGPLEETNKPYALAKIAGVNMCQSYNEQYGTNFISVMPTNLYGPNDNYDLQKSHVLPALIRKFHEAKLAGKKQVEVWGTGKPMREFLHVDDLADACLFLMESYSGSEMVNIGWGKDLSIADLAGLINTITQANADIKFNTEMPDGTYRKLLDVTKLNDLGWTAKISLEEGIAKVYAQYAKDHAVV